MLSSRNIIADGITTQVKCFNS